MVPLERFPSSSDPGHGVHLRRCAEALAGAFGRKAADQALAVFVPGRIELFGKHTDYAGGRSLLAAVDRGFRLAAAPREDNLVRVVAADGQGPWEDRVEEFPFDGSIEPTPGHWRNYPMTVARRLARNFAGPLGRSLRGADIAFASDLPPAAGLSSSSAMIVAFAMVLAAVNRLAETDLYHETVASPIDLAMYLAAIENGHSFGPLAGDRGVGTFGGSEDHTIILCATEGHLSQFSFAPTRHETDVAWPEAMALVVATSGVVAEKTGARMDDYNRLSRQAALMTEAFNEARGTGCRNLRGCVETLAAESAEMALEHFFAHLVSLRRELADWDLPGRAMQFRAEDQVLIPQAAEAIAGGQWEALGALADRSHALADQCLRNQTPETNALQLLARALGAVAASGFGAGFGGSVWAVVGRDQAARFAEAWQAAYAREFPEAAARATVLVTGPFGPARRLMGLD